MTATRWRKSSRSFHEANCVEVAGRWRKSSRCQTGECAEVTILPEGSVGVRDSKDPDGPVLIFQADAWRAFLASLKLPPQPRPVTRIRGLWLG